MSPRIDFEAINAAALGAYPGLLERWLPGGRLHGKEYRIGDMQGNPGDSLAINIDTGKWSDFANPEMSGGDAISLYAALRGIGQGDAAKELSDMLGVDTGAPPPAAAKGKKPVWTPVLPAPDNAPAPAASHYAHGTPAATWCYRDAEGRVLGYVYRFNMPDGGKEVIPHTFCQSDTGKREWRWLSFPKPRPLYGLDILAKNPTANVVICEGEKAADAARVLFPQAAVVTWPGGGKAVKHADWTPLRGRKCVIWPDADEPGMSAAMAIADTLDGNAAAVRIMLPPAGKADGWDARDALDEGWTPERTLEWLPTALREPAQLRDAREEPPPHEAEPGGVWVQDAPQQEQPADTPYQCLGHDHGHYFYMSAGARQVLRVSGAGHSKASLLMLAPLRYWEREFPSKGGADWDAAANSLLRTSERIGIYDQMRVRGRGAWWDAGQPVLHLGDRLVVDGAEHDVTAHQSKFIYEAAAPISISTSNPAPPKEAVGLLELCRMLSWETPMMATLLAGWCVVAPICGALRWRPHIWITGPAGSGKTWVYENVLCRALGDVALAAASETTEAGLRQALGSDARPVVFDEADQETARAQSRIQNVMALMRQASSETSAAIFKGTTTGEGMIYRPRSCFAFCSINVGVQQHADQTRVTVLTLVKNEHVSADKHAAKFQAIQEKWLQVLTPEFVDRLHARTVSLIPVIRQNAETFAVAGARVIGTRRLGDQLGALLAGAHALHSSKAITLEEATAWLERQDWAEAQEAQEDKDELVCLSRILEHMVSVQQGSGRYDRTISELIDSAASNVVDEKLERSTCVGTLKRYGIKVEDGWVLVSNQHSGIARLLANTPWAANWGRILKRVDGARPGGLVRFGTSVDKPHRTTALPISTMADTWQREPGDESDEIPL